MKSLSIALLSLLLCASASCAQIVQFSGAPTQVIPTANNVSANWAKAGLAVIGGIPTGRSQCGSTLNPSGLTPPVANDDAALLVAKIAGCSAGTKIVLGSGTFNYAMSELPIIINKGVTISGSGSTTGTCNMATGTACWPTILQTYDGPQPTYNNPAKCGVTLGGATTCPNGSGMFLVTPVALFDYGWATCIPQTQNPQTSNCGTLIAADVAQGATAIQVASTTNFSVGMWFLLDEAPVLGTTTNPVAGQASIQASAEFLNTSASPAVARIANPDASNCTYSFCTNRVTEEIHKITAIGAGPCPGVNCTLTFDSPLTIGFRQSGSHLARAYWPTNQSGSTPLTFVDQAGFENLTINRCNGGCIAFLFASYGWIKNVEANYWINGAANVAWSARIQMTGNYFHNCIDCQNNGVEYPVAIDSASLEVLLENNIIAFGGKGMVGRAATGAVIAYNYFDKTFYMASSLIGDYWNDMSANGSHYAGTHHFLFEGNWANNCDGDDTHGNATYHTFFRNQCTGYRSTFVDPSNTLTVNDCAGTAFTGVSNTPQSPGPLRAAGPMAFNYWYAFSTNVLGLSGMQSCAGGAFTYAAGTSGFATNRVMWLTGWTGGEWGGVVDSNLVTASPPFIFRNGNFDYVTSTVDSTTGFASSSPNSLYILSAPSYFGPGASCTYTWPWVTPTSGSKVQANSCAGSGLPAKARFDAGTPFVQP